jgi:hypothetical protein
MFASPAVPTATFPARRSGLLAAYRYLNARILKPSATYYATIWPQMAEYCGNPSEALSVSHRIAGLPPAVAEADWAACRPPLIGVECASGISKLGPALWGAMSLAHRCRRHVGRWSPACSPDNPHLDVNRLARRTADVVRNRQKLRRER